MRVRVLAWLLLVTSACAEPCEPAAPLVEINVVGEVDPSAPAIVALRLPGKDWSNAACQPDPDQVLGGVPTWQGECDLIALQLGSIPEESRLEIAVLNLDGMLTVGNIEFDAPSCETSPTPYSFKAEPILLDDQSLCEAACHARNQCLNRGETTEACGPACEPVPADELCVDERRARLACQMYLACDWYVPEEPPANTPCTPFDEALAACEAGL